MTDIVEFWSARPLWFQLPEEARQTVFEQIRVRLAARSQQSGSRCNAHRCSGHGLGYGEIAVIGFSDGRLDDWHCPVVAEDELLSRYFEKVAFLQGEKSAESYAERLRGGGQGGRTMAK